MQQDRRSANHLRDNFRIAFEVMKAKRNAMHKRYAWRMEGFVMHWIESRLESNITYLVPLQDVGPFDTCFTNHRLSRALHHWPILMLNSAPLSASIISSCGFWSVVRYICHIHLLELWRGILIVPTRIWERKQDDVIADSYDSFFSSTRAEREVTRAGVKLDPRYTQFWCPITSAKTRYQGIMLLHEYQVLFFFMLMSFDFHTAAKYSWNSSSDKQVNTKLAGLHCMFSSA